MKKLVMLIVLLVAVGTMASDNGITIWGLTNQDADSVIVRIGYEQDNIEGFIGSSWWPNYDVETGDIQPPQVLILGALYHFQDLLDPNNPLPIIPDILIAFVPKGTLAQPYIGGQGTFNFIDKDAGFYGGLVGLLVKANKDSKVAIVVEAAYQDNFIELSAVDNFKINLGLRFKF